MLRNSFIFSFEMKSFVARVLLFLLPVILVTVVVFLQPLDKQFAYNFVEGECDGRGKWIYDRLHENEAPVDVAIIGTSVGWGLFDDQKLTSLLTDALGTPTTVANLSFCRPGQNIRTLIVEDVLIAKSPKHIILEVTRDPSWGGHPVYGYLASNSSLWFPATRLYQPYHQDLLHGFVVRWEMLRTLLYPKSEYLPESSKFGFAPASGLVDQAKMKLLFNKEHKSAEMESETLQEKIQRYTYWENLEYVKNLCDKHHVKLSLFYVNTFGARSKFPRFRSRLEAIGPIKYAPDSIFQNPQYYVDVVHFNHQGAEAVTPVLLKFLVETAD